MSDALSSTCSQLSSTNRSRRSRRCRMTVSRSGSPAVSRTPSATAIVGTTSAGLGQQGEIDDEDPIGIAIERLRRHLQRQPGLARSARTGQGHQPAASRPSSRPTATSSSSRPISAVGGAVRLVGWLGSVRSGGNCVGQSRGEDLEDLLRLQQIAQAVAAEGAQGCAGRQLSLQQPADRLGQQHLLPMPRGQQAGEAIQAGREVIAITWLGHPGVQRHAHPERTRLVRPGRGLQRPLSGHRRRERWRGRGEGGLHRVADGLEGDAAM